MNADIFESINNIVRNKGLPRDRVIDALKEAILVGYRKRYGMLGDVEAVVDKGKNTIKIRSKKRIVERVRNSAYEINIDEAKRLYPNCKVGDDINVYEDPSTLGRAGAQAVKQVVAQKLQEIGSDIIYEEFKLKEGEIVKGYVLRRRGRDLLIDLGKTEGILPARELSPRDRFGKSDIVKAIILSVRKKRAHVDVILSRANSDFVKRLFYLEVPELYEGYITIEKIVREPGFRTKMAVSSSREDLDPVGTCVGVKGVRIQEIIKELNGERIDVIPYSDNIEDFIKHSIQPAKAIESLITEAKKSIVVVSDNQLTLAVGKDGVNVRLASQLTGYEIDVYSESQYEEEYGKKRAKEIAEKLFVKTEPTKQEKTEEIKEKIEEERDSVEEVEVVDFKEKVEEIEEEIPLEELPELGKDIIKRLKENKIYTIDELIDRPFDELVNIVGKNSANHILNVIKENVEIEEVEE
jgi:N utilization substance protein A